MADWSEDIAHILLKHQVEEFLYHEVELLDERHYEDWLALLADDGRYWMPTPDKRAMENYPAEDRPGPERLTGEEPDFFLLTRRSPWQ
jgi:Ring hydroxylating beta subunit